MSIMLEDGISWDRLGFYEALRHIVEGQRVTKLEWDNSEYWGQMLDGKLVLHKPDGIYYPWILSDGDVNGSDWLILSYA